MGVIKLMSSIFCCVLILAKTYINGEKIPEEQCSGNEELDIMASLRDIFKI